LSTENQLARHTLTARHVAVMAMAATGPAAVLALNFGVMGAMAGPAFVLALVFTMVAVLLLANTLVQFSHRYPSAGAIYTWVTRSFGQRTGFILGWLFAGSYILLSAAGVVVLGYWGETITGIGLERAVPWWVWTAVGLAFIAALAYRGIAQSARSMLVLFAIELAVVLALALWIIIRVAVTGELTTTPFQPSAVPGNGGWAAIGLAMTFGVLSCVGLEEATTLAEETANAKRAVARGVLLAAILIPATYVVAGYAVAVGLGAEVMSKLDAATADPLGEVTVKFWGDGVGLWIVFLAVLSSILAFTQTAFNAGLRVLYALGRERLIPRQLGRTHPVYKTPHVAIGVVSGLCVVLGVPLAIVSGALNVWIYYGFMISVMFLVVYATANVALITDSLRHHRDQFHLLKHGIFPALGMIAMAYPLYRTVWPLPDRPLPQLALVVVGWIALGAAVLVWLSTNRPEAVRRAGLVMGELADLEDTGSPDVISAAPHSADPARKAPA
jgi:amino acid transporter